MTLAPLTSLGLVSSHTNLLATGQRRYAIKRSKIIREAKDPAKSKDLLFAYVATNDRQHAVFLSAAEGISAAPSRRLAAAESDEITPPAVLKTRQSLLHEDNLVCPPD